MLTVGHIAPMKRRRMFEWPRWATTLALTLAAQVTVRAEHYSSFDPGRWWETREGVRTEIVELQKLLLDVVLPSNVNLTSSACTARGSHFSGRRVGVRSTLLRRRAPARQMVWTHASACVLPMRRSRSICGFSKGHSGCVALPG
jgi:hypothetical protein